MAKIPAKSKEVYIIAEGRIDTPDNAAELLEKGAAVPVNLAYLDNIQNEIEKAVDDFRKKYDEIELSPRYDDMPSERAYQLEQLKQQLEATIEEKRKQYKERLAEYKAKAQRDLLNVETVDEATAKKLDAFAAAMAGRLAIGDISALDELAAAVQAMSFAEKSYLTRHLPQFKQAAAGNESAERKLQSVAGSIIAGNPAAVQLKIIEAKAQSTAYDLTYRVLKKTHRGFKSQEVKAGLTNTGIKGAF